MIDRVWIGPELEGYQKGIITLFIESLSVEASEIINLFENPKVKNIKRIYLGAGGQGIYTITNHANLLEFIEKNNIDLMIECYNYQLRVLDEELLKHKRVFITQTIKVAKNEYINFVKFDDDKTVQVYDMSSIKHEDTDLSSLEQGLYKEDELIYRREDKCNYSTYLSNLTKQDIQLIG